MERSWGSHFCDYRSINLLLRLKKFVLKTEKNLKLSLWNFKLCIKVNESRYNQCGVTPHFPIYLLISKSIQKNIEKR